MIDIIRPVNERKEKKEEVSFEELQDFVKQVEAYAKGHLSAVSHGFDHTRRVYNLALVIGQAEKADMKVLLSAALLHDIGRALEEHMGADHAETSAYFAKDFLKSIKFPEDKIKKVFNAIIQHRFSSDMALDSLEGQILSDADKLDALGAIGVARAFTYGGRHNRDVQGTINHFNNKLLKLKDEMYTNTAKNIAEARHKYTADYLNRLQEEIQGLK